MSKVPHKLIFNHKEGSSSSLIDESNLKENNNNNYITRQRCRKSKTIRNENPDILINPNESENVGVITILIENANTIKTLQKISRLQMILKKITYYRIK